MSPPDPRSREIARDLSAFIDASPSPFHACAESARRLESAGFRRLAETEDFPAQAGRYYVERGGSLAAWAVVEGTPASRGFRLIGAHTDSPNLRVKPQPDTGRAGLRLLGVEIYGGVLLNSWLDRDLSLSGRVWLRGMEAPEPRLFRFERPLLRVPQLAIHLDREINTKGLLLNKQTHMAPVWTTDDGSVTGFRALLGRELEVDEGEILAFEAMCHDVTPSSFLGADEEFLVAPRLDNLCSSYTGLAALLQRVEALTPEDPVPLLTLFDHEEVGSASRSGAEGPIAADLLERSVLARGGTREDTLRAIADSVCLSADMAHATHPNYLERHEPDHQLSMNGGPAIKINANLRYATEGETEALFQVVCERAGVPVQKFVGRTDLACGATIGSITAARLGVRTVDVGCAQLSMHSAREMCGAHDPAYMLRAMVEFLR